jgi:Putative metal-binding motif/RTX calcium-binding nonapeptide repeat (4 copies)
VPILRLCCLLAALTVAALAAPSGAHADGGLTLVAGELRYDSDSQDAENLVITRQTAGFECGAAGTPCLQFANGPQNIRDAVAGTTCAQVIAVVVSCSPTGVTSILLELDDGDDFVVVGDNVPVTTMDGSFDNDNLSSSGGADIVVGGPGDDEISDDDSNADDLLDGGADDDSISTTGGDDDVIGGAGADTAILGSGDETVRLDDLANDGRPGEAKNIRSDIEVIDGRGGSDNLFGNTAANTLLGGAGDDLVDGAGGPDVLDGGSGADELNGGPDVDRVAYAGTGEQAITLDDVRNDGAAGELDNVHSDIEDVAAGPGNDNVVGSDVANVLDGGDGDDRLEGRGAVDTFFGGQGADALFARDGAQERVECGTEADTGEADTIDLLVDCEGVLPGTELVPDVDGDGVNKPSDCNDDNAAIRPGAPDVPQNGIDEDCSGGDAAFPVLTASLSFSFSVFRTHTRLDRYRAVQLAGDERIRLRCKGRGCPFRVKRLVARKPGSRNMTKLVRNARFRAGTVLEAFITRSGAVGRYRKLRFRAAKPPRLSKRCVQPGASTPAKCPG